MVYLCRCNNHKYEKTKVLKQRKTWLRIIAGIILLSLLFLGISIVYIAKKQNSIIKSNIASLNNTHKGLSLIHI